MDRFEVAYQTQQYNYAVIYIPVWIDLKPVHYQSNMLRDNYLHSSMDRFEASKVPKVFTRVKYLHSSMDRFEGLILRSNAL